MTIGVGVGLGVRFDEVAVRGTAGVGGARSVMIVSLPDARSVKSKNKQWLTTLKRFSLYLYLSLFYTYINEESFHQ